MSNFRLKITPETGFAVLKGYRNNQHSFELVASNEYQGQMSFAINQDGGTEAVEVVLCEDGTWHMVTHHFVEGTEQ
jgi:hypothetical protein